MLLMSSRTATDVRIVRLTWQELCLVTWFFYKGRLRTPCTLALWRWRWLGLEGPHKNRPTAKWPFREKNLPSQQSCDGGPF